MAHEYEENPADFHLFKEVDEYIDLVIDYVEHLHPDLVLERFVSQSPKELLIAPDWGLKNYEFVTRLQKRMKERGAYQGKKYRDSEKRVIFAEDNFTTE
jgi:radical SAM superfamily enzyme